MYFSGTFVDFESRLHQLPVNSGDFANFISEGCSYYSYISTGDFGNLDYFILKWNREFAKRGYAYYPIGTGCGGGSGSGIVQMCYPVPSGIVAWYKGEGNAQDVYGNNGGWFQGLLDANNFTGLYVTGAEVGTGLSFNGVGYITIPANDAFNGNLSGQYSVEFWLQSVNNSQSQAIVVSRNTAAGWMIRQNGSNLEFYNITPNLDLQSTIGIGDGNWHHIACVYDGFGQSGPPGAYLYIDGVENKYITGNGFSTNLSGNGISLGANYGYNPWEGNLDEVSFYNVALTPAQISGIYATGSFGKCVPGASPIVPIEDVNGNIIYDVNGNPIFGV